MYWEQGNLRMSSFSLICVEDRANMKKYHDDDLEHINVFNQISDNKIENLQGPPNGCFSVSESMRVTYRQTGLLLEVLADLKIQ